MNWLFSSQIIRPDRRLNWQQTHSYIPTPWMLKDRLRVFTTFWDAQKIGRIGFVDLDLESFQEIGRSQNPTLDVGDKGCFDEHGVTAMSLVEHQNELFLFYTGWQRTCSYPYTILTGVAKSKDGGQSFERLSQAPLLDRKDGELFVRSAAFAEHTDSMWNLYYIGGDKWFDIDSKLVPSYDLRCVSASDLQSLRYQSSKSIVSFQNQDEYGLGRPWLIRGQKKSHLWFSVRTKSQGYYLGYAWSLDGVNWVRDDKKMEAFKNQTLPWARNMQAFAAAIVIKNQLVLFFNGDEYGKDGFSWANIHWNIWDGEN